MIFDAHGDILTDVEQKAQFGVDIFRELHLPMYNEANVMGSIFVNYTDPYSTSQKYTFNLINEVAVAYMQNSDIVNVVEHDKDFRLGKINVILGIEGAKPLADINAIEEMYNLGYRHIGLTWNERNQFGCGISGIGGLTELGEEAIRWCNKHGMIIDFAHLNFQSFLDGASITDKPILFSHGNAYELCNNERNLTDFQLKLIKESDGVIGITAVNSFLSPNGNATIDDFVEHVLYVKKLIGIRHIGLGLDYCHYLDDKTANNVTGLEDMAATTNLRDKFRDAGLSDSEIDDVLFKNMLRVVKAHLRGSEK